MSHFTRGPPSSVYQSCLVNNKTNKYDSGTPLPMAVSLSDKAQAMLAAAPDIRDCIHAGLRRFDGLDLEKYDAERKCMVKVRLSQDMFYYEMDGPRTLRVHMHRKELPVSGVFGGAPFILVLYLRGAEEVVVSDAFMIGAKQMEPERLAAAANRPLKRPRILSRRRIQLDVLSGAADARLNELLQATRSRAAPVASPLPPGLWASPAPADGIDWSTEDEFTRLLSPLLDLPDEMAWPDLELDF